MPGDILTAAARRLFPAEARRLWRASASAARRPRRLGFFSASGGRRQRPGAPIGDAAREAWRGRASRINIAANACRRRHAPAAAAMPSSA